MSTELLNPVEECILTCSNLNYLGESKTFPNKSAYADCSGLLLLFVNTLKPSPQSTNRSNVFEKQKVEIFSNTFCERVIICQRVSKHLVHSRPVALKSIQEPVKLFRAKTLGKKVFENIKEKGENARN